MAWAEAALGGRVLTLVGTDVDSIDGVLEMFHETWAQVLEVVIGTVLLSQQVGWLWPLPLFIILCEHISLRYILTSAQCSPIHSVLPNEPTCCKKPSP